MAIVLYNNGITEDFKAKNLVFTEQELLSLFSEFHEVKTKRVIPILNTWCIFGKNDNIDDFNRIASDIVAENVYSHALFVHDSEINPDWRLTDDILYKPYSEFVNTLKTVVNQVATKIVEELQSQSEYEGKADHLPLLTTIGTSSDKKIIFEFDPYVQSDGFFKHEEFDIFSKKIYDYLSDNKQKGNPFKIYEDKKAMIVIDSKKVNYFLKILEENFKQKEEYEVCTEITKMMKDWEKTVKPARKSRRKKSDNDDQG